MSQRLTEQRKKIMQILSELGCCYRRDIALYCDYTNGKLDSGTGLLRNLKKQDMISERKIPKETNSGKYLAVNFSYAGKWFAIRHELYDDEEETKRRIEESSSFFDTHDMEDVKKRLLINRISLAFESIGVPSLPSEKPSLASLYTLMTGNVLENTEDKVKYFFLHSDEDYKIISEDEFPMFLESGIFYTIHEIRDFIERMDSGKSDVVLRSRARGIYISKNQCFVIYAQRRGRNKNIAIETRVEKDLVKFLEPIIRATNIVRELPTMQEKTLDYKGEVARQLVPSNHPQAIVIGDGEKMHFSLSRRLSIKDADGNESSFREWLTSNKELYDYVFSVSFNAIGLDALSYLCTTTIENWQQEMLSRFSQTSQLLPNEQSPMFPYLDKTSQALMTYMPVYEINTLEKIKNANYPCGVFTYPDMVETISKITGKKLTYYDLDTCQPIQLGNNTGQYDDKGNFAGVAKINAYLASEKLQAKKSDINKLPKKYGMSPEEFFNQVADGRINVRDVSEQLETSELKRSYTVRGKEQVSITCDREFKKDIKDAARYYGISVSRYIKRLVSDKVKEDAKNYREETKNDKKLRKQTEQIAI